MRERGYLKKKQQNSSVLEEKVVLHHIELTIFCKEEVSLAFLTQVHVFRAPKDRDTGWHKLSSAVGSELVPGTQNQTTLLFP